jgi:hypothetical protein
MEPGRCEQFESHSDKLLTSIFGKLPVLDVGLFDEYHSFPSRRAFDDGLYRRLDSLPGCDPLHTAASRLSFLRI